MEFLSFLLFGFSIYIAWLKPQKENWAFGSFVLGMAICFGMFTVASWKAFLPFAAY